MRYKRQIILALFLALAICSFAFWTLSDSRVQALHWTNTRTFVNLASTSGCIRITFTRWPMAPASAWQWSASSSRQATAIPTLLADPQQQFAGFQWDDSLWRVRTRTFSTSVDHVFAAPYWAVCTLFCLPLAPSIVRYIIGRTRARRGLCPHCGYDLRASPQRCPECGSLVRFRGTQRDSNDANSPAHASH
jgi:hypothetical protein